MEPSLHIIVVVFYNIVQKTVFKVACSISNSLFPHSGYSFPQAQFHECMDHIFTDFKSYIYVLACHKLVVLHVRVFIINYTISAVAFMLYSTH